MCLGLGLEHTVSVSLDTLADDAHAKVIRPLSAQNTEAPSLNIMEKYLEIIIKYCHSVLLKVQLQ